MTDYDARRLCYEIAELVNNGCESKAVTALQIEIGLAYQGGQYDAREARND